MKIWGIWKENLNLEIEPLWWEYGGKISKIQDFLISTSVRQYHEISTQIPPGEFINAKSYPKSPSKGDFFYFL